MKSIRFWLLQTIAFIGFSFLALRYYPMAFPIVNLQIQMDRTAALKAADEWANAQSWGPKNYRQAASFDSDDQVQTYVELSQGTAAFERILKEKLYYPYTWRVRHFAEGQTNETHIIFTPQGDFYGFSERIPENSPGPALSQEAALKVAEQEAIRNGKVDFSAYQLVEKSKEERPNHRVDHTFTYERTQEKIGEGRYRLKLVVSGDKLTELVYGIKVPDSFLRQYSEMRSFNNTIASIASIGMLLIYIIGGCGVGLFFLFRGNWVIWKTPLLWGIGVAALQTLEQINQLPLQWMNYDTALPISGFLLRNASNSLISFLVECLLLSASFMAAESLSRKAFPKHPQLWKVWSTSQASSLQILGRTVGGYLWVGFFFAYLVLIYHLGRTSLGWWTPSDTLFQPDSLASYFPWLTGVARSLHAGFWEECLFRAVPLAGAALLGTRFGHKNKWIGGAFILQALIFAAAHANYPAQPSYARVVELILPSCLFGGLYLTFGLLPGIILHYTFDVISFSIPLFVSQTPRIWIDRGLVILISLIPLWIVLGARLKTGKWGELKKSDLNEGWKSTAQKHTLNEDFRKPAKVEIRPAFVMTMSLLAVLSLGLWFFAFPRINQDVPLSISRDQAIILARQAVEKTGFQLSPEWQPLAKAQPPQPSEGHFIWKTESAAIFSQLMGKYLSPSTWLVRFVKFYGDVNERAEEFQVFILGNGEIQRVRHELPENRKGNNLEQQDARKTALRFIAEKYSFLPEQLREVSSQAFKLPNRRDWLFIFQDPSIHLKLGEARIGVKIAGDQVSASKQFVFIPEDWERKERGRENILSVIRIISVIVIAIIFLNGLILAILNWTKKNFNIQAFKVSLLSLGFLNLANWLNSLPSHFAQFSTQEPKTNQMVNLVGFSLLQILVLSGCGAVLSGYLYRSSAKRDLTLKSHSEYLVGISSGIVLTCFFGCISQLIPLENPTLAGVGAIDSAFPFLMGIQTVDRLIFISLGITLVGLLFEKITASSNRRKLLGAFFTLIFGLAGVGLRPESIIQWLTLGSALGLALWVTLRYLVPGRPQLIPLMVAGGISLLEFRQLLLHPYLGSTLAESIAIVFIWGVAFLWHHCLRIKT